MLSQCDGMFSVLLYQLPTSLESQMRPHTVKSSLALFIGAQFLLSISHASEWSGSYSAGGQCHCVGDLNSEVKNTIVPTPIGGQTVAQVCQRLGAGPGLSKVNGEFDHPVYKDPQCGHGPFNGDVTVGNTSDNPLGPKWDLKTAFAKKPDAKKSLVVKTDVKSAVANAGVQKSTAPLSGAAKVAAEVAAAKRKNSPQKPVVTSVIVKKPANTPDGSETVKTTVVSSASTAARDVPKKETLPPFTGKVITIDGKRYMQARDDIPAKGGAPGSRIILDGSVYLLDDGKIQPTDLYRRQFGVVKKSSGNTSSRVKSTVRTNAVAASKETNSSNKIFNAERTVATVTSTPTVADRDSRNQIPRKPVLAEPVVTPVTDLATVKKTDLLPAAPTEQVTVLPKPMIETETDDSVAELELAKRKTEEQVAATNEEIQNSASKTAPTQVGILSALKLPASARGREDNFSYVEALPASFDVGGSGVVLKGSTQSHSRFHYVGRVAVTNTYQEVMIGGGLYLTPRAADRFTMVLQAGVEHGSFQLEDDQDSTVSVNYGSSGLYFGAATRMVVNRQMELRGGLGYSTFFKGDLKAFGGAYWHLTPQLDVVSRFELGDNDLLGLGIRYYY